jgi:hypothetical protein
VGEHPATGNVLGRAFGDASARGFDVTFSAPKTVSVLWGLSPDRFVQAEVAVAATLGRSATVAAIPDGARPWISASHNAISARTAFFGPRNTRPTCRAGASAVAGTKTRAK